MITGKLLNEKQYRQLEFLSSTDVRTFVTKGREEFYKRYILKEGFKETRSILIGNLVHTLLLEPETFDEKYTMSICKKAPTGKMLEFVNALFKNTVSCTVDGVVTKKFKDLAEIAKEESGFLIPLDTIIRKFTDSDNEKYYQELLNSIEKPVVSIADKEIAERILARIKTSPITSSLFQGQKELKINNFKIGGLEFKAMLDDVEITDSYVLPSDLKVVWNNEGFLEEYYKFRRADLQAAVYTFGLEQLYPGKEIKPFRFIAIDSTNKAEPLIYQMTTESINFAKQELLKVLEDIKWHLDTGIWNISRENYLNNGIISI